MVGLNRAAFLGVAEAPILSHRLACLCMGSGVVSTRVDEELCHVYDCEEGGEGVDGWELKPCFFLEGVVGGGTGVEAVLLFVVLEGAADSG